MDYLGFPGDSDYKKICLQYKRPGFDPWIWTIPWRREWLPNPVFLTGEFRGHGSLAGYNPWGHFHFFSELPTNYVKWDNVIKVSYT